MHQYKEVDEKFLDLLKENEVSYIPTLIVSNNYNKAFSKSYPFTAEDFHFANPHTIGDIQDLQHIAEEELESYVARMRKMEYRPRKSETLMGKNLKKVWDKGINVVVGTDAGNIGTFHASSYFSALQLIRNFLVLSLASCFGVRVENDIPTIDLCLQVLACLLRYSQVRLHR